MTGVRLAELEKLCELATPGPWTAFTWNEKGPKSPDSRDRLAAMSGDDPDAENAGQVLLMLPDPDPQQLDEIEKKHEEQFGDANDEAVANDDWDSYVPCCVPDNGLCIASKREVNCGYEPNMGDSIDPADIYLRPGDARFIAEARTAIPELIGEVRRLRAALDGESMASRPVERSLVIQ